MTLKRSSLLDKIRIFKTFFSSSMHFLWQFNVQEIMVIHIYPCQSQQALVLGSGEAYEEQGNCGAR